MSAPRARWLSPNAARRRVELFVLAWSPAWIALVSAAMLTRAPGRWGDAASLAFALSLAAPLWLAPLLLATAEERRLPLAARHGVRFNLFIALLSLVQTYAGSDFFFDRLGMEYHFPVALSLHGTPLFLYLLTAVYFSTYYVAMGVALRALRARFPGAPPLALWLARVALGSAVAFGETWFMASELLAPYFLYRDRGFVLRWGSFCYGTVFFVTLPLYEALDEERQPSGGTGRLLWDLCAANLVVLALYQVYGMWIRPR